MNPSKPSPRHEDRDYVGIGTRAPEEQTRVGHMPKHWPEPFPHIVGAGGGVIHFVGHDAVSYGTARNRRDDADIMLPPGIGQVEQHSDTPDRRAMAAAGQSDTYSGHTSCLPS